MMFIILLGIWKELKSNDFKCRKAGLMGKLKRLKILVQRVRTVKRRLLRRKGY